MRYYFIHRIPEIIFHSNFSFAKIPHPDKIHKKIWAGSAAVFFILSFLAYAEYQNEKKEMDFLREQNETVTLWAEKSHRTADMLLMNELLPSKEESLDIPIQKIQNIGFHIESITDKPVSASGSGEIRTLYFRGTGSFYQILEIFDIINEENQWISIDILKLDRKQGMLFMEAEIKTFLHRGKDEEKEYRSHWTDGNRKKQGGTPAG